MPHKDMNYEYEEDELSLLDIFMILWRRKWLIFFLTFLFGAASIFYALSLPLIYRAECRIIPPRSSGGLSLGGLGGIADLVGLPSGGSSGQMIVGILKGDSVVDAVIEKFNLMKELSIDIRLRARAAVLANLDITEDAKSGILGVAYLHETPQRAADMANAFVDELQRKLRELSVNDAQQRMRFFESQLMQAQQELNMAEADLINYQQSRGVIAFESQTGALLASINSLRNRIAAKNVEISTLSSYARRDNPRLRLAQSELDAMNKELRKLEEEQKRADRWGGAASGDLLSSIGQVPELGVEYQRYMRNLRFATAKYELMLRQYENARLSEASDLSTIMIIDSATPPDYKYKPRRARIVIVGTIAGFALGVFWAFLAAHISVLLKERRKREYDYEYDDD
ncbi:MAG: hypothetical protein IJS39_01410 [Synergistaceae bacterium]|nr:hypothetical protein [Synergistaceae bacterium]